VVVDALHHRLELGLRRAHLQVLRRALVVDEENELAARLLVRQRPHEEPQRALAPQQLALRAVLHALRLRQRLAP
jgi:hypothetical protein